MRPSLLFQNWRLAVGGWWRLAVAGSWLRLAAVGGWRLVVSGVWRLAVGGGWRGWRLAVGGLLGLSLAEKKSRFVRAALGTPAAGLAVGLAAPVAGGSPAMAHGVAGGLGGNRPVVCCHAPVPDMNSPQGHATAAAHPSVLPRARRRALPWAGAHAALPTPPPPHKRTIFLWKKTKLIKGAGNLRPTSGTQTSLWPLPPPPAPV